MPISEAKRRANDAYNAKCKPLLLKPLIEEYDIIAEAAAKEGKSKQRFVLDCVEEHLGRSLREK